MTWAKLLVTNSDTAILYLVSPPPASPMNVGRITGGRLPQIKLTVDLGLGNSTPTTG